LKNQNPHTYRILISGGGTGGHVYPALAIADAFRKKHPNAKIEFVGAEGRMEMEKVPQYGYEIHGLWISGIQRKNMWKNILLPFKMLSSWLKVRKIINNFKPDAVVGVGGYASGPLLHIAAMQKTPSLIQEQNSYPGITNKILAKKADTICVAYEGLEKFFPANKVVVTGNPVRDFGKNLDALKNEAYKYFGLNPALPVILVVGGSLGARSINQSILQNINQVANRPVQLLWQTGKFYFEDIQKSLSAKHENIHIKAFIDKMEYAYAVADVVVSRAGAISISELSMIGKPVILVPSPNVAEDHQTKNAQVLEKENAAILIRDSEAMTELVPCMLLLANDKNRQNSLAQNILKLAKPNAAERIVEEIEKLIEKQK
jgi:UDP-N-acetylglucosamine--N-acetylmuramyl-(pentapeptide) pyrophosphoryl-undecaprenol N-acetylglucosamine transferase